MRRVFILLLLIALFFICFVGNSYSNNKGNKYIDSLLIELSTTKDTSKVNTLNSLSKHYSSIAKFDLALKYANEAKQLAEKITYNRGLGNAITNIGVVYWNKADFETALIHFNESLKIHKQIKNKKGTAICYNNIGLVYWNTGDFEKAVDYILKSLKIWDEINDKGGIAMGELNIGNIYLNQKNNEKALEHYSKSLKIAEDTQDKPVLGLCLNNIGVVYGNIGENEKAIEFHTKALKVNEDRGDEKSVAMSYSNLGLIYMDQKKLNDAFINFKKSAETGKKIGDLKGLAVSYNNMANVLEQQGKYAEGLNYNNEALAINKKIGYKKGLEDVYRISSSLYEGLEDYRKALEYYQLYTDVKDSLLNEESSRQIAEMSTKYGSEKKDKEIQLLNEQRVAEAKLASAEKRKNQFVLFSVLIVLLLVIIFTYFIYRNSQQKQKLNEQLEKLSIVASETDNGVLICDPQGTIEWANVGLTKLLGYTFEELKSKGTTIEQLSSNPQIREVIDESIKSKKSCSYQVLNKTKDGSLKWTQSTLTPIIGQDGIVQKLVIIDTDISERKKIEDLLSQQNKELEQSHRDITILNDIGKSITSILSVDKIVEKTYGNINKLMDADIFCIGIYNKAKNSIDFPGFLEKGVKYSSSYDLNDTNRLPVICFKNQTEILINDLEKDYIKFIPTLLPPLVGEHPESLIYLPLILNNKIIGVINVESFSKNAYTPYHVNILKNLAIYVAIAIENAKLYEILETKVEERTAELVKQNKEIEQMYSNIQVLNEIGQEITSTLNLEQVLDTVYAKVNSLMDATEFGFGIYNTEKAAIDFSNYYYESKRMDADLDTWVSMEDDNRLSVWCVKNKKPVFINHMQVEYKNYIANLDSYQGEGKLLLESVICLPLTIEEKLVGVISVQSPHRNAYTQKHLEILQTLASSIAIALDNARLYNTMEDEIKERTKEIEKQKIVLEDKNLKITDSINYALRIQQAILPSQQMMSDILPDSFILFQPKDIVSGDFYWAHAVNQHEILFAAVDCTGHGVPGAFMSIMGYNLLEQIVKEQNIHEPASILNELSKSVIRSLKQTAQLGSIKEGMDIALCKINYTTLELEYAGAHNPLTIVRKNELIEVKADNKSIGISHATNESFKNNSLQLEKNDCIYIFSDGYADQKGGAQNQKFFYKPFKQLLIDINNKTMKEQEKELHQVINNWKGEKEQIDDILVIGVRV
ncbi:MAG: tetratricopeptide repeat protein [Bacteroidia bacterium]